MSNNTDILSTIKNENTPFSRLNEGTQMKLSRMANSKKVKVFQLTPEEVEAVKAEAGEDTGYIMVPSLKFGGYAQIVVRSQGCWRL